MKRFFLELALVLGFLFAASSRADHEDLGRRATPLTPSLPVVSLQK